MPKLAFIILLAVSISVCSKNKKITNLSVSQEHSTNLTSDNNEPTLTFETEGVWCNLCPSVKISIFSDRKALIESEYFAEQKTGEASEFIKKRTVVSRKLSDAQFAQLIKKFDDINFFDLADNYIPETDSSGRYVPTPSCPQSLSDGPTFHIYYRKGSRSKMVNHYDSCEADENSRKLPELEKLIEKMFNTSVLLRKSMLSNTNVNGVFKQ